MFCPGITQEDASKETKKPSKKVIEEEIIKQLVIFFNCLYWKIFSYFK